MATKKAAEKAEPLKGEPAAEWVAIKDLAPWAKNPRKNDKAAAKVADSIKRFGFAAPIVARREDGQIIAGHTRLKAAKMLKLDRVPVRFVDLDPADARLLALADNKLGEIADWDPAVLADVLSEFSLQEAELAGWDSVELEKLADQVVDFGPLEDESMDGSPKLGDGLVFSVVVECDGEGAQSDLIARLEGEGYKCRALMS